MKTMFLCLLMAITLCATAQVSDNPATASAFKAGAAYVHDFPGLNGYGVHVEYAFPLSDWAQLETGLKRIQASGYPGTAAVGNSTVQEYTKSTTLDFNVLFVPLSSDQFALKIGGGYSFVFYNLRRAMPVFSTSGGAKTETWYALDDRGRTGGCSLIGEYEYYFSPGFSAGLRASLAKAYSGHVWMGGPFVAVRL